MPYSSPQNFQNCIFNENEAVEGGAVYIDDSRDYFYTSVATFTNVSFIKNYASHNVSSILYI